MFPGEISEKRKTEKNITKHHTMTEEEITRAHERSMLRNMMNADVMNESKKELNIPDTNHFLEILDGKKLKTKHKLREHIEDNVQKIYEGHFFIGEEIDSQEEKHDTDHLPDKLDVSSTQFSQENKKILTKTKEKVRKHPLSRNSSPQQRRSGNQFLGPFSPQNNRKNQISNSRKVILRKGSIKQKRRKTNRNQKEKPLIKLLSKKLEGHTSSNLKHAPKGSSKFSSKQSINIQVEIFI